MSLLHEEGTLFLHDGETVKPGYIPYITIQDLTEIKYREAELEENILREDLSWQDKTAALNELHDLRVAQNPAQTKLDTAREITKAKGKGAVKSQERSISRAQVVAKFLDDPDVARAKNEGEAFKVASRKLESQFAAMSKKKESSVHGLYHGEFISRVSELRPHRFAAILADPPYGIGADKFGDAATLAHQYGDTPELGLSLAREIIREGYRLTDLQGYLFLFCDIDLFLVLREFAETIGWKPFRTPLVWQKGSRGHVPEGYTGWRRSYEIILAASKGNKKLSRVVGDVIDVQPEASPLHAAAKPVELYKRLLSAVTIRGDKVLDPCCGSGTIFPAAHELGLIGFGVEAEEKFFDLAKGRMSSLDE